MFLKFNLPKNPRQSIENKSLALYVFTLFFCSFAILLTNFLAFHQYSLLKPEVFVIYLTLFIVALGVAVIVWKWRGVALFVILPVFVIYLNTTFSFHPICEWLVETMARISPFSYLSYFRKIGELIYLAIIVMIHLVFLYIFIFKMGKSGWKWLSVGALITLIAIMVSWFSFKPFPHIRELEEKSVQMKAGLPLLIYIIWDEHMSIKWVPENIPHAQETKKEMMDFYDKYNFRLYTDAFSHHHQTVKSISNVLNFSADLKAVELKTKKGHRRSNRRLMGNKVFQLLKSRGYDLRVYQSEYMNFCDPSDGPVGYCYEHGTNCIGDIEALDLQIKEKAFLIAGHWLKTFPYVKYPLGIIRKILTPFLGERINRIPIIGSPYNRVGPINVVPALEQIKSDIYEFPKGKAFFAHLLMLHYPYVFEENNRLKKNPKTWLGPDEWYETDSPPSWEEQYEHYYAQVRGLYKYLDNWFEDLNKKGLLKDAVIIFHGDHGSRICHDVLSHEAKSHEKWDRIVKDVFTTLFAARDNRLPKGQVATPKPIDVLLYEFFNEPDKMDVAKPESNFVYVPGESGKFEKYYK
jgi:hypothetical protein